jgi:hypothetical protein
MPNLSKVLGAAQIFIPPLCLADSGGLTCGLQAFGEVAAAIGIVCPCMPTRCFGVRAGVVLEATSFELCKTLPVNCRQPLA